MKKTVEIPQKFSQCSKKDCWGPQEDLTFFEKTVGTPGWFYSQKKIVGTPEKVIFLKKTLGVPEEISPYLKKEQLGSPRRFSSLVSHSVQKIHLGPTKFYLI